MHGFTVYCSQLFTEYGRLAMDEIFLKPFQVRVKMLPVVRDIRLVSGVASRVHFAHCAFSQTVFNVPYSGLELSL